MSSTKQLLEEEPPLATTRRESGMGEHAMDTLGLGNESIVMPVPHPDTYAVFDDAWKLQPLFSFRLLPVSKIPNGNILSKHDRTNFM